MDMKLFVAGLPTWLRIYLNGSNLLITVVQDRDDKRLFLDIKEEDSGEHLYRSPKTNIRGDKKGLLKATKLLLETIALHGEGSLRSPDPVGRMINPFGNPATLVWFDLLDSERVQQVMFLLEKDGQARMSKVRPQA